MKTQRIIFFLSRKVFNYMHFFVLMTDTPQSAREIEGSNISIGIGNEEVIEQDK